MISHGIMLDNAYSSQYTFIQQILYTIGVTFWIPAAMIFVLISGYFGINTSWKGLIRYSILCIFYCTLLYLIGNNTYTFIGFIKSFIFLSVEYSGLWFISSYFYLYCIAPIINTWHNSLDKYQMRTYIICFACADIVLGFIMENKLISMPIHFILLYSIGHYLKIANDDWIQRSTIGQCALGYLITTSIYSLLTIIFLSFGQYAYLQKCFNYLNPIIIVQSIFILLTFTKIHLRKQSINNLALSVFPVYLISENINTRHYFIEFIQFFKQNMSLPLFIIFIIIFFIIAYFILIYIDKFLSFIYKPFTNKIIKLFRIQ